MIMSISAAVGQACDNSLQPVDNLSVAYQERSNRCEGFYISNVSSKSLDIVSFTVGEFRYELSDNEIINLSSPTTESSFYIRAQGIPLKTYYRMDAYINSTDTLKWPIKDVVFKNKLSHKQVGVFGWIKNEKNTMIYIPIKANSVTSKIENSEELNLYLRTSIDVYNIKWRYGELVNNECKELGSWIDISEKTYKAGKAIKIILPKTSYKKIYIEVAAQEFQTTNWIKQNFCLQNAK